MCKQIVLKAWNTNQGQNLQMKIDRCSASLWKWGQEITGSFKNRIKEIKKMPKVLKHSRDGESVKRYIEE